MLHIKNKDSCKDSCNKKNNGSTKWKSSIHQVKQDEAKHTCSKAIGQTDSKQKMFVKAIFKQQPIGCLSNYQDNYNKAQAGKGYTYQIISPKKIIIVFHICLNPSHRSNIFSTVFLEVFLENLKITQPILCFSTHAGSSSLISGGSSRTSFISSK